MAVISCSVKLPYLTNYKITYPPNTFTETNFKEEKFYSLVILIVLLPVAALWSLNFCIASVLHSY
jgi:hypothetical protein